MGHRMSQGMRDYRNRIRRMRINAARRLGKARNRYSQVREGGREDQPGGTLTLFSPFPYYLPALQLPKKKCSFPPTVENAIA